MAVKMRLMRMGKTKSPFYRVVVIDGRAPRDGRYIDLIGRYDPREDPSVIDIDNDKAVDWLRKGAQPTDTVSKLLQVSGALDQYKVKAGKIHTVGAKKTAKVEEETSAEKAAPVATEAPTQEAAAEEAAAEEAAAEVAEVEEAPAAEAPTEAFASEEPTAEAAAADGDTSEEE